MKSNGGLNCWAWMRSMARLTVGEHQNRNHFLITRALLGQSTSHFPASFWQPVASAIQISYPPALVEWKNLEELRDWGIPICVFTAVHLGKDLEDFTTNRCAIPRRVFGFCCMLLKVNMKQNINDFQRLDSRVIGKTVSEVQLPICWLDQLLCDHSQVTYHF